MLIAPHIVKDETDDKQVGVPHFPDGLHPHSSIRK